MKREQKAATVPRSGGISQAFSCCFNTLGVFTCSYMILDIVFGFWHNNSLDEKTKLTQA